MTLSEKISTAVLGMLYIGAGATILLWPTLLYYGLAAIFFVHGSIILLRMLFKREE